MIWCVEDDASIRRFVANEIDPFVDEWEANEIFPAHELFKKMGQLGFLGISKPEAYGGLGLDSLVVGGQNLIFDLSNLGTGVISGIERIDLGTGGTNRLVLDQTSLTNMGIAVSQALTVDGNMCKPEMKEGAPVYQRKEKATADEKDSYFVVSHKNKYKYAQNMFFPRMYSSQPSHVSAYKTWANIKGTPCDVNTAVSANFCKAFNSGTEAPGRVTFSLSVRHKSS